MSKHRRSKKTNSPRSTGSDEPAGDRLQKVLAASGVASRRECEEWIQQGRVEVDGQVVVELGTRVEPLQQQIREDGVALARPKREYFIVNKPVDVLCTNHDPSGRTRVFDLLPTHDRLFTVGRLDRASEGLILITNDGDLAHRLMHPRFEVEKTYQVRVAGLPSSEVLAKLQKGVHLAEGVARVAGLTVRRRHRLSTDMEVVLKEGKNREIRRVLARVGHKVMWLKRIALGPLRLGNLPVGGFRRLTADELRALQQSARGTRAGAVAQKDRLGQGASASTNTTRTKIPSGPKVKNDSAGATDSSHNLSQPNKVAASAVRITKSTVPTTSSNISPQQDSDWEAELLQDDSTSMGLQGADSQGLGKPQIKTGPFRGSVLGYGDEKASGNSTKPRKSDSQKRRRTNRKRT